MQQFEAGISAATSVETLEAYGHVSGTITVAKTSLDQPPAKKMKQDRLFHDDVEGYVVYTCTYVCGLCMCVYMCVCVCGYGFGYTLLCMIA